MNRASHFVKLNTAGKPVSLRSQKWVAVLDESTGLIWSRDYVSPTGLTWKTAQETVKTFELLGRHDWRVPTRVELLTLVDDTRYNPAIDVRFFPECQSSWHWTCTPAAFSPGDYAWVVGFNSGGSSWGGQLSVGFVRAVRVGQSLGIGSAKVKRSARR